MLCLPVSLKNLVASKRLVKVRLCSLAMHKALINKKFVLTHFSRVVNK